MGGRFRPATALLSLSIGILLAPSYGLSELFAQQRNQEERLDYYQKWLKEDVVYIITPEEKAVFGQLSTDEERDRFIEQFWLRRDPDPRTRDNEYKVEHYRRIAYANDAFAAGWPGWMTDRGKVYIIHGPPDEIEENPSGGEYERTLHEGGGRTSVFPYEKWRYHYIEGMGNNVEIEFVDRDFSGVYRLSLSPEDKDAFLHTPNMGFTIAEELGLAERRQRPYYAPHATYPLMNYREQDSAFARYERLVNIQRPVSLKHPALKEIVDTRISYTELPFGVHTDVFRLNDEKVLTPITVHVRNQDLTFAEAGSARRAQVAIYGVVSNLSNQVVSEFEDEVVTSFAAEKLERGLAGESVYNRVILLDAGGRYKLQLAVKDLNSGHLGVATRALAAPSYPGDQLLSSPLVISDYIVAAEEGDRPEDRMFVLGNVRVRPSLGRKFTNQDYFALYWQVYHVALDQSSQAPSFQARYRILKNGAVVLEETDEVGTSVQYYSPQRMVLIKRLDLDGLTPGEYQVEAAFEDRIRGETVTQRGSFAIVGQKAEN